MPDRHTIYSAAMVMLIAVSSNGCGGENAKHPTPATTTTRPVDPTTGSAAASTSTTTTTSTTLPTTTTVPIEQQLKDAIESYKVNYFACGLKPAECDITKITAAGSVAEAKGISFFGEMTKRGLYVDASTAISYTIKQVVADSPTQATVDTCVFDNSRLLGPAGPDGQPTVIADGNASYTMRQIWVIEAGVWKLQQEDRLETLGAGNQCGP